MLPNQNLTKEEAKWLIEFYGPKRGNRIDNTSIGWHNKAFNYIRGTQQPIPDCSCQWTAASKIASSLYDQHEAAIKEIAYAV